MSVRQPRGRPPLGSSRAGIPAGTLQGGSICRGRNGEVMRSAGTDSTWRCRAVDFECILFWQSEVKGYLRFVFA